MYYSLFSYLGNIDIQSSKIELAKLILNLENPEILEKIKNLLQNHTKEELIPLSDNEKKEIELV